MQGAFWVIFSRVFPFPFDSGLGTCRIKPGCFAVQAQRLRWSSCSALHSSKFCKKWKANNKAHSERNTEAFQQLGWIAESVAQLPKLSPSRLQWLYIFANFWEIQNLGFFCEFKPLSKMRVLRFPPQILDFPGNYFLLPVLSFSLGFFPSADLGKKARSTSLLGY